MFADRVKETTTSTGTGTINLAGPVTNFIGFVAGIGDGNICYYAIVHQSLSEWEVGIGTVTDLATDTLSRTTVLASSNANALVNFSAGTKDVFNTIAANIAEIAPVNAAPKSNVLIPVNESLVVNRIFLITSGKKVTLQSGAKMRIL